MKWLPLTYQFDPGSTRVASVVTVRVCVCGEGVRANVAYGDILINLQAACARALSQLLTMLMESADTGSAGSLPGVAPYTDTQRWIPYVSGCSVRCFLYDGALRLNALWWKTKPVIADTFGQSAGIPNVPWRQSASGQNSQLKKNKDRCSVFHLVIAAKLNQASLAHLKNILK